MLGPTPDIIETFTNLVTDFNNVYNTGDYEPWAEAYLFRFDDHLLINRVDDPGKYVEGPLSKIIYYFNNSQRPQAGQAKNDYFPQFSKNVSPQEKTHINHHGDLVGEVTPTPGTHGIYYDTYQNYLIGTGVIVDYTLRFKQYQNIWYLCTGLVVPVPV
jgi:hypothetical protein